MAPQPPAQEHAQPQHQELPASLIRAENEGATTGTDGDIDTSRGAQQHVDHGASQDSDGDAGLTRREVIQRSPNDDKRSAIASRFRREEPENERPFNNDFADPENLYGEAGRTPGADELNDDDYDAEAELAELTGGLPPVERFGKKPTTFREDVGNEDDRQPQRRSIGKVRGKEVFMSDEEILEAARKIKAGDSYLDDTRRLLEEAKEINRLARESGRQPPGGEHRAHEEELDPPLDDEGDQPLDPSTADVVRAIQYGDPEDAARLLDRVVEKRANRASNDGAMQRSFDQDLARSKKQLAEFSKANPAIAADEISAMAIEKGMYDLYKEDILALGIDPDTIPKTPKELANWHRFYRVHGYEVRATKELLEASKDSFLKWRGGSRAANPNPQPSRREAPRVRVNVQRDERRMAIPVQPQRGVVPRRDAPPIPTGSSVVANMRKARGQV